MGITSLNRETSLEGLIEENRRRKLAGMPKLGKASMVDLNLQKAKDAQIRKAYPHKFFDSQRHIDRVRDMRSTGMDYSPKMKPSMSAPSVGQVAMSAAGTSTYTDLLKKQWGMI